MRGVRCEGCAVWGCAVWVWWTSKHSDAYIHMYMWCVVWVLSKAALCPHSGPIYTNPNLMVNV